MNKFKKGDRRLRPLWGVLRGMEFEAGNRGGEYGRAMSEAVRRVRFAVKVEDADTGD